MTDQHPDGSHRPSSPLPGNVILSTGRLVLRKVELSDWAFILTLLNDPSYTENIGDRGLRTKEEAQDYIRDVLIAHEKRHGFALWLAVLAETGAPIGLIGLVKRDYLDHVDLGFALMPEFHGQGLAREGAAACLDLARDHFGLATLSAIVSPGNKPSTGLLEALGFRWQRDMAFPATGETIHVYSLDL